MKECLGGRAIWSSDMDVGDEIYPAHQNFGPAQRPTRQRYLVPQMVFDGRGEQQVGRPRVTISTRQSRGPDADELHARLSSLPIPSPVHNGSVAVRQSKSPFGRTSPPEVYGTEEFEARACGEPMKDACGEKPPGRRASSERRRLQKRRSSSGSVV